MKRIFQLLLLLLAINTANSQTYTPPAFADVDNNYRTYVNNVFGALEANRVPTGLLADYGFDFTDPKIYNGSVLVDSTLMEQGIYSELYKTIFTQPVQQQHWDASTPFHSRQSMLYSPAKRSHHFKRTTVQLN